MSTLVLEGEWDQGWLVKSAASNMRWVLETPAKNGVVFPTESIRKILLAGDGNKPFVTAQTF